MAKLSANEMADVGGFEVAEQMNNAACGRCLRVVFAQFIIKLISGYAIIVSITSSFAEKIQSARWWMTSHIATTRMSPRMVGIPTATVPAPQNARGTLTDMKAFTTASALIVMLTHNFAPSPRLMESPTRAPLKSVRPYSTSAN
jgi:hypothetical protein